MPSRDWPPPSTLVARSQRLAACAYREIELARRSPDRAGIIHHCRRAAVFMEELTGLVRTYGSAVSDASNDATPVR